MDWWEVAKDFADDGALRDIYVFGTSPREWQAIYDAVRVTYPVVLHGNGNLPGDVRGLRDWEEVPTLTVDPDGMSINCHFFGEQEVEFDLAPNLITSQADLDRVCQFLTVVGRAAGKDAVLTMENCPDWIILRYDVRSGTVAGGRAEP